MRKKRFKCTIFTRYLKNYKKFKDIRKMRVSLGLSENEMKSRPTNRW